jgi:hypothetical protein
MLAFAKASFAGAHVLWLIALPPNQPGLQVFEQPQNHKLSAVVQGVRREGAGDLSQAHIPLRMLGHHLLRWAPPLDPENSTSTWRKLPDVRRIPRRAKFSTQELTE